MGLENCTERKLLASLVDISTKLSTLTLRGPLIDGEKTGNSFKKGLYMKGRAISRYTGANFRMNISVDSEDDVQGFLQSTSLALFLLFASRQMGRDIFHGLVLSQEPAQSPAFRRIGRFFTCVDTDDDVLNFGLESTTTRNRRIIRTPPELIKTIELA